MKGDAYLDYAKLTFGKYKDVKPEDVAEHDPEYIVWMYETIKNKPTCSAALYRSCLSETKKTRKGRAEEDEEEKLAEAQYGYLAQN